MSSDRPGPETIPERVRRTESPAVVLGVGSNGLSFMRSLGRRRIPVTAVEAWRELGMLSRYCRPFVSPDPVGDESATLRFFEDLARELRSRGVLLATTDAFVSFIAKYHSELERHYDFNVSDLTTIESLTNKKRQYDFARSMGVPIPRTLFPSEADIERIATDMTYPCILKPHYSHLWQKYLAAHPEQRWGKVAEVQSPPELVQTHQEMSRSGLKFMVQEKIGGGDDQLYGVLTYLDRSGEALAIFTKRKLRQCPKDYGVGSFQIGVWEPEVAELGLRLLRGLKFRGLAGVEFKKDANDGQLKLMEINPRSISQTYHAVASGVDVPYIAYRDALGARVEPAMRFREGIKWLNFGLDLESFRAYRRERVLELAQWVQSWKGERCYAFFAWDDPMPGTVGLGQVLLDEARRWSHLRSA